MSVGTKKRERETESLVVVLFLFGGKELSLIIFDGKKKTKQICVFCTDWNFGRWENVSL